MIMAVPDTTILRTIERKIDKEGLDPSKVDVLVMHGHVTLTGHLVSRVTQRPLEGLAKDNFMKVIQHVDGVNEVTFHTSDAAGFI